MVGILLSYWDGLFSGAMLVSGRVYIFFLDNKSHKSTICVGSHASGPWFIRSREHLDALLAVEGTSRLDVYGWCSGAGSFVRVET